MPEFRSFPFYSRPDLSPYLIHLTKSDPGDGVSARNRLLEILRGGVIKGSSPQGGFIKGNSPAVCFMDVPFMALKYVLTDANVGRSRYEPYGLVISKPYAYKHGARPALYLSREEITALQIPDRELWRVVHLDGSDPDDWSGWLHEREWRVKGDFQLPHPYSFTGVLVKSAAECELFRRELRESKPSARGRPRAVIPLQVVCQGLTYLGWDEVEEFA